MKRNKSRTLLLSTLLACSNYLYAGDHDHAEHEEHAAHVHGKGQLLVALEGDTLEIEFMSPAMNIVGFEHQPANESQIHAVKRAIATLKQPGKLFNLSSKAGCIPVSIKVESPLARDDHHEHSDKEHTKEHEEGHSDFDGRYRFQCSNLSTLKSIEVKIFDLFPGTEKLEAQRISTHGQQKIDLSSGNNLLEL